jgi:hypothetical protein
MFLCAGALGATYDWSTNPGDGSPDNPYQISEPNHLMAIGSDPNLLDKCFVLTNDIDLDPNLPGNTVFKSAVIAPGTGPAAPYQGDPFTGRFDGNYHKIANLTIYALDESHWPYPELRDCIALFGRVDEGAVIESLVLDNVSVEGDDTLAALVAYQAGGTIRNCGVSGIISGGTDVGALVGTAASTSIVRCYARCSITGYENVGGLAGSCVSIDLQDSYSQSNIQAAGGYVGGLVGLVEHGTVTNCYSTGQMGAGYGLMSDYSDAEIYNSFWDYEASGLELSPRVALTGPDISSSDMKDASLYSSNCWGANTWTIDVNDYPALAWENLPGTYIAEPIVPFNGEGTQLSPYEIEDFNDLRLVASGSYFWDKSYVLLNDIDLSGRHLNSIGYNQNHCFAGTFYGNHRCLSNLAMDNRQAYFGLFGYIGQTGRVQDLNLPDVYLRGLHHFGSVAGLNKGSIENCTASGSLYARIIGSHPGFMNMPVTGGIVGQNDGTILGCEFSGAVTSPNTKGYLGGFAGCNYGTIRQCRCSSTVLKGQPVSYSQPTGGFVADNFGILDTCFAETQVSATCDNVGGLVGRCSDGEIKGCCSRGTVRSGSDEIGGLIGRLDKGYVYACYSTCDVSAKSSSGHFGGLVGLNYGSLVACYSTGTIKEGLASEYYGGLVGENAQTGTILQCYSTSFLRLDPGSWTTRLGGLVGYNRGSVEDSYWDIEASAMTTSYGGVGLTTEDMHRRESFVGFDFDDTDGDPADWQMPPGNRPALSWEQFVAVPDVVGLPEVQALAVLEAATVRWSLQYNYSDYPTGTVAWQIPDNDVLMSSLCPVVVSVSQGQIFAGGEGIPADPYQISTPQHLMQIGDNPELLDKAYILVNDIAFDPNNDPNHLFTRPVIASESDGAPFSGTLDGDYHKILNLRVNVNGSAGSYPSSASLFGYIEDRPPKVCTVKNLTLESAQVTAYKDTQDYCGSLVGHMKDAILQNCHVRSSAISGDESVGGLAGYSYNGSILFCSSSDATVLGAKYVGGLLGYNKTGLVISSFSGALISTPPDRGGTYYGGLVGFNYGYGINQTLQIDRCYFEGEVEGGGSVGGIAGYNQWGVISNCYSSGTIGGRPNLGGIVGQNDGDVYHCYASGPVTGFTSSRGGVVGADGTWSYRSVVGSYWDEDATGIGTSAGGTGLTTDLMKQKASFEGWDFVGESANGTADIWRLCEDLADYPRLSWQFGADLDCPDGVFFEDVLYLAGRWLETDLDPYTSADRTGDAGVDFADYALLAESWLEGITD